MWVVGVGLFGVVLVWCVFFVGGVLFGVVVFG